MEAVGNLQDWLMLIIGLLGLGLEGFALQDALRARTDAFTAAGKLTKPIWLTIVGVAAAIGLIVVIGVLMLITNTGSPVLGPFNIFNLIAFVAAGVYLADVRPAVKSISGGGSNGPYGRW
jgi:hypothetical protein